MLSYIVIHSDEGLTLEISVLETLHGGQFTLSTQLIKYKFEKKRQTMMILLLHEKKLSVRLT